jgi:serine/threonine-protein kinase
VYASIVEMSDQPRDALPVPEGTVIAGKYVVGRLIAAGGMGVVAEGRHQSLDQRVALKFLLPATAKQGTEAAARFLREAQAAARIESDHVVKVYDVGEHGDVPYMVMEYLEGRDVQDYVGQVGPLPVSEALELVTQALDGLALAHQAGIVHRDLKPSNLFITERGRSRRLMGSPG